MRREAMLFALVGATAVTGCAFERTYDQGPQPTADRGRFEVPRDARVTEPDVEDPVVLGGLFSGAKDGFLTGDIGPARNIDNDAPELTVYDDGWYAAIETVDVRPGRAAMLLLMATLPEEVFVPGTTTTYLLEDSAEANVTMLGCTGQTPGNYDEFDVPADEVDVIVEEGEDPGEVQVQVQARWTTIEFNQVRTADAGFTLVR